MAIVGVDKTTMTSTQMTNSQNDFKFKKSNLVDVLPFLNSKYTKFERYAWFLFYTTAVLLSGSVCYQLLSTFLNSPIVVSVEPKDDGLSEEVFPTVSICNIRKWLAQSTHEKEIYQKVVHMQTRITTAMPHCSWRAENVPCDHIFEPVLTDWESFCYSFNYGRPEKSNTSYFNMGNYSLNIKKPRKAGGLGINNGLSVIVDILRKQNGNYERYDLISLKRESLGLMVLVHSPDEFPLLAGRSMHITPGLENNFKIEANKVYTSDNVKNHFTASRNKNCFFEGEKKLAYFDNYSTSACNMECVLNMTLSKCGCHHWTTIGFLSDAFCSTDNQTICHMKVADGLMKNENQKYVKHWKSCNCKARCSYTTYSISSSYALLDASSVAERFNTTTEYARYNMLIVNVFFGEHRVTVFRRDVLSTISNLCSNIGGILGSILGLSLISIIRISLSELFHLRFDYFTRKKQSTEPKPFYRKKKIVLRPMRKVSYLDMN